MRVVLDTNVVVSAFLSAQGAPARIFRHFQQEAFELVVSAEILAEYQRALGYEKVQMRHGLSPEEIADAMAELKDAAIVVTPHAMPAVIAADPDDDKFFACALTGGAQYLVSGDANVQAVTEYQGVHVVSPTVFVAILAQTANG